MPTKKKIEEKVEAAEEALEEVRELAAVETREVQGFQETPANLALLKKQFNIRDDTQLQMFMYQVRRTGLDPLARQIYALSVGGRLVIQTSIDGYRLIAERSGKYSGQTKVEYDYDDQGNLVAATIGVWRKDNKEPTYATAFLKEFKKAGQWTSMPHHMLAKVAESLALRKAFPQELSGLYTEDEMGHTNETQQIQEAQVIDPEPPDELPTRTIESVSVDSAADLKAAIGKMKEALEDKGYTDTALKVRFVREIIGHSIPKTVDEAQEVINHLQNIPF